MTITARLRGSTRLAGALAIAALALVLAAPASAQDETPAQLLEDFVHYSNIAKPDLAAAYGQRLLDSGITCAELAALLDEGDMSLDRFDNAVRRMMLVPEMEDLVAEIGRCVEQGRLDLARDSARIDQAIGMLGGTQREKLLAQGRLKAAGEYAVPALLRQITEGRDEKRKQASKNMIVTIGRQAVTPLCEALGQVDPQSQRVICEILGDIRYPHAAPYLRELSVNETADAPVRQAAERAFRVVGGAQADPSILYSNLGYLYYDCLGSLIAYPYEETNNIWDYDWAVGLVARPVPTVIYCELMSMRLARKALQFDPANRPALSLFVAANLKRENSLPQGESDPIEGEGRYSPSFYATVFGTQVCLDVLALGIDTTDTPLVRDAIAALSQTTGGSNLFGSGQGRRPLIEALSYPDRRVQYESSLTLARALPDQAFAGADLVVPLLASAVRTSNQSFGLVVADEEENRRQAVIALENLGYTIAGAEESVEALRGAIAEAVGVDVVIVWMDKAEAAKQAVSNLRNVAKTVAAPVAILAPGVDVPDLRREYHGDGRVKVSRPGLSSDAFAALIDELLRHAAGGRMTDAEAEAYAIESLQALEDIAISNSAAYPIAEAESALLDALESRTGGTRLLVADILALIDTQRAQRKLFDMALAAAGDEKIDLLDRVAASVKRFGSYAERRHIIALLDLVTNSSGLTAEAAARLHGALNLPSTDAVRLVQP
jgi:CheY-like chemotaxis protein